MACTLVFRARLKTQRFFIEPIDLSEMPSFRGMQKNSSFEARFREICKDEVMNNFRNDITGYCRKLSDLDEIFALAYEQRGMVTSAQAGKFGISSNQLSGLVSNGTLERRAKGIYRLTTAAPDSLVNLRALWMRLEPKSTTFERLARPDPGGVVAYRTAAAVHRLGRFRFDVAEFVVKSGGKSRRPGVRFHCSNLSSSDWTIVDGLPVTTVLATTRDLAMSNIRDEDFTNVIRDALLTYHVDLSTIGACIN